jgi:two-component SAPR family response regulator
MGQVDLGRRRILVVEDEYLLAADIVDQIEDHNGIAVGPVVNLRDGLAALEAERPDACIVNIHLGPDVVYELADRLMEQQVPFVFASSETRAAIPDRFKSVPLHSKPIDMIKAASGLINQD